MMASGWVSVCRWMSPWRSRSATPEGRTRGRTEVVEAMWIESADVGIHPDVRLGMDGGPGPSIGS